jgi:hypothetical protein
MKSFTIRTLFKPILVISVLLLISIGGAWLGQNRHSARARAAGLSGVMHINLISPSPDSKQVLLGQTQLVIDVLDYQGNPINDATVSVIGDMDEVGMIPVLSTSNEGQIGRYTLPFEQSMCGEWVLTVEARLSDGRAASKVFRFTVLPETEAAS